ncbi:ATP-binding protein [Gallaecimonas kandeliae]|uniref:GAF domain-containing sensor histidine kinase n=1 Tax=Gallaecimonas kandeliae TaxID=3029055 RepID=UPI002647B449|nr:ATP-binding protein [Gallaecimonas kandeliae]WKE65599.1 ATP-binding protein [Gallaecimonas kandeliae]
MSPEQLLRQLVRNTDRLFGEAFFEALVANLGQALKVRHVSLTRLLEDQSALTLAVWNDGPPPQLSRCDLSRSPGLQACSQKEPSYISSGVLERYPDDPLFKALKAEAYFGVPLLSRQGRVQGLLALAHTQPLELEEADQLLLELLADRVEAELDLLDAEAQRRRPDLLEPDQRDLMAMVASRTNNLVYIRNAQDQITWVNDAFTRITGYRREDALGQQPADLLLGPERPRVEQMISRRQGFQLEAKSFRKDGSAFWLKADVQPLFDEGGEFLGHMIIGNDVTELRQAEEVLAQSNARLEEEVAKRTQDLSQANLELQLAMEQLVQSRKLASLGALVAGIAHELNTPMGNALTVATSLEGSGRELQAALDSNALTRSGLAGYVDRVNEGCRLISRSLTRSAELVSSFKQVAVDQSSTMRRGFDLALVLEETLATLKPGIRKLPIDLALDCPALEMESYPGPLEQVVTNLVLNAVTYAFKPGQPGQIRLSVEDKGKQVTLQVADDGKGIDPEILDNVFDPFVSSQLGQGGSGLGLYIVYTLVTGVLGGQIQLTSSSQGTRFTLTLPKVAPLREQHDR